MTNQAKPPTAAALAKKFPWLGDEAKAAIAAGRVVGVSFKDEDQDDDGMPIGPVRLHLDGEDHEAVNAKDSDMKSFLATAVVVDRKVVKTLPPTGYLPEWFRKAGPIALARALGVELHEA